MNDALILYNIFPRYFSSVKQWEALLPQVADMGFNGIFLNPLHLPGFSGSLYSVSDYYAYNPALFADVERAEIALREFILRCRDIGLDVYMDLVANHTAIDSPLTHAHGDWYARHAESGEIERPCCLDDGETVVWGDLARLDHAGSPDRIGLWGFFAGLCRHALSLGFRGFRCDAAYQAPVAFWSHLLGTIKAEYPQAHFLAETLGCSLDDTRALTSAGFDYIFNSSKWWDFKADWCLEQYAQTRLLTPSISFSETHDSARLMSEMQGNSAAFLQRLLFSCFFSTGFMALCGQEYGFTHQPHVVQTTPADWQTPEYDFRAPLQRALTIKRTFAPLHEEGPMIALPLSNTAVLALVKHSQTQRVILLVNRDVDLDQTLPVAEITSRFSGVPCRYSPTRPTVDPLADSDFSLHPGEVAVLAQDAEGCNNLS